MAKISGLFIAVAEHPVRSALVAGGFATMLTTVPYWVPQRNQAFEFGLLNGVFCLGAFAIAIGVAGPWVARWVNEHLAWRFARRKPVVVLQPEVPISVQAIEPDVPLGVVVRRIVEQKGGLPDDRNEQAKLIEEINREIAAKVKFKGLTVYGCQGARAPEVLSGALRWAHANVDILKMRIWFPGSWSAIDYENIMFLSAEVDDVWPPIREGQIGSICWSGYPLRSPT